MISNDTSKQRETDFDIAKGIGMLAVMIAHMNVSKFLYIILYTFHLPLFFIISGYFFHYDENVFRFAYKKINEYFIPYIFCSSIIVIFDAIGFFVQKKGYQFILLDIKKFVIQMRYTTLWFLATLFLGIMIFWLIHWVCRNHLTIIMLVSISIGILFILYDSYGGKPLPWNLDTAFIIQIYLSIGYFINQKQLLIQLKKKPLINSMIFAMVSILCSVLNFRLCKQTYEMYYNSYGIFPLTITAAVMGSVAVILVSSKITTIKPLEWLGRNTLVFFAFHQSIGIPVATSLLNKFMNPKILKLPWNIVYTSTELVFVLLICCGMYWLIIKMHLGVLIGKRKSDNTF